MEPDQRSAPLSREQARALDLHLVPGLRNRLIAELVSRDIPRSDFAPYLRSLTGRDLQTVKRWIVSEPPGLPDPTSLAILALQLNLDPGWLLGLARHPTRFPYDRLPPHLLTAGCADNPAAADWVGALLSQIGSHAPLKVGVMRGQEMAPLICDGTPYCYDDTLAQITCDGVYLLAHDGHMLVRHVERRPGEGLVLRCENRSYSDTVLNEADDTAATLVVLGRLLAVFQVSHL